MALISKKMFIIFNYSIDLHQFLFKHTVDHTNPIIRQQAIVDGTGFVLIRTHQTVTTKKFAVFSLQTVYHAFT